ncbi:MAG: hypothetical protein ACLR9W_02705 [Enterobacter hormaechei]
MAGASATDLIVHLREYADPGRGADGLDHVLPVALLLERTPRAYAFAWPVTASLIGFPAVSDPVAFLTLPSSACGDRGGIFVRADSLRAARTRIRAIQREIIPDALGRARSGGGHLAGKPGAASGPASGPGAAVPAG